MELKVTNKRLDTRPIGRRLTQGESLVDRPRIVLQKTYEGLDISGYSYEIRAVSDKDTLVRRPLDKTVEGDKLILLWTVTAEFTSVSGPLALTIVGMDEAGNEIIKITSDKIIIREDPEGAWTAPPPDVLNDALRQMAILQNAAVAAKNAAEAAQRAAEAAQDAARESETAAAVSAAGAEASKDQTDDIREDTAGIKAEAEKVLEDTQVVAEVVADLTDKARQYAELASQIAFGQKGWFPTPEAIKAAYPTGEDGWWAVVGTTDTIWVWDSDRGDWVDSRTGTDMAKYPQWAQLENKLLVPCTCTYNAETHVFSLTRRDVNQLLQDEAELTFLPPTGYTRGDKVEFEGREIPLEYTDSPVDIQSGAWLANRPAKLIWYADNEQGGIPNEPLRARRRTRS